MAFGWDDIISIFVSSAASKAAKSNNNGSQTGGVLDKIEGWLNRYPNTINAASGIYTNMQNQRLNRTTGQNMEEQILTGKKYGIHPLEAIGGNISGGTTIPLQNPLANIQPAQPVDVVEVETKKLVLENLRREAKNSESLLVGPVSAYPGGKKEWWGLNGEYFGYTFVSSTLMMAANGDEALKKIMEGLNQKQRKHVEQVIKRNYDGRHGRNK